MLHSQYIFFFWQIILTIQQKLKENMWKTKQNKEQLKEQIVCILICTTAGPTGESTNQFHSVFSGVRWADAVQLPINLSVLLIKGADAEQWSGKSERTNAVPGPIINIQHQILVSSFWVYGKPSSTPVQPV